jgi:HEAT repeat protein
LKDPTAKIPVLVKLRRCTSTIEALIQDFFGKHQLPLSLSAIEHLLQQGKLLLLLDGLNELPDAFRTEIANFREKYRKSTPMVVSTREQSIGGTLGINKTLKMLPLTEPQMQEFLRGYLSEEGDRLFQQLKGDRLRKFAETPLLLWMLCRVFAEECSRAEQEKRPPKLPDNLGLAFREFTQLYDQKLQEDAPTESRDQWSKLLQHLAFALMHDKEVVEFRLSMPKEEAENLLTDCLQQEGRANAREYAEKWLQDLLDYHLIQPVTQPNLEIHIEFRHQLIQEYYAAEYLLRLLPDLNDEELKRDYLNLLKWTEPIALMLALVDDEAQALRVVKLAINDVDLMLGARLAGQVNLNAQEQTIRLIASRDISTNSKIYLLDRTSSELAIPELQKFVNHEDNDIRGSAFYSIGKIGGEPALRALDRALDDNLSHVRLNAVFALSEIGSDSVIPSLIKATNDKDPDICSKAIEELGKVGNNNELVAQKLSKILEFHNDDEVSMNAAVALITNDHKGIAIKLARKRFNRDHSYIVRLREIYKPTRVTSESSWQVKSDDESNQECKTLQLTDSECLLRMNNLTHPHIQIRGFSIKQLGEAKCHSAILPIARCLGDSSSEIRCAAVIALGQIGDTVVIPYLLRSLQDKASSVRLHAIDSLVTIADDSIIPELLKYLAYQTPPMMQRKIAKAISKLGQPSLIRQLYSICLASQEALFETIFSIQNRCKFYNYEIFQGTIPQGKTISLYFSYAPADEPLQTHLSQHLTLLERQGIITSWSQRQILPGDEPAQVVNQQLNTADIILLLISANSLADDTCYNLEIQRAIERHQAGNARVIPILLRPVDWAGAPFSQLEVLPRNHQPVTTWANQDEAFREIAEGIRAVAMEVRRVKAGEQGSRGVEEIDC